MIIALQMSWFLLASMASSLLIRRPLLFLFPPSAAERAIQERWRSFWSDQFPWMSGFIQELFSPPTRHFSYGEIRIRCLVSCLFLISMPVFVFVIH